MAEFERCERREIIERTKKEREIRQGINAICIVIPSEWRRMIMIVQVMQQHRPALREWKNSVMSLFQRKYFTSFDLSNHGHSVVDSVCAFFHQSVHATPNAGNISSSYLWLRCDETRRSALTNNDNIFCSWCRIVWWCAELWLPIVKMNHRMFESTFRKPKKRINTEELCSKFTVLTVVPKHCVNVDGRAVADELSFGLLQMSTSQGRSSKVPVHYLN